MPRPPLRRSVPQSPGAVRRRRHTAAKAKVLAQWLSSAQLGAQSVGPLPARSTPQLLSPPPEPHPALHPPQRGSVPAGRRKAAPPPWPHPQPDRNRKPWGFLTHPARCSPWRDPGVQGDLAPRRDHREPHAFLMATLKEGPPQGGYLSVAGPREPTGHTSWASTGSGLPSPGLPPCLPTLPAGGALRRDPQAE